MPQPQVAAPPPSPPPAAQSPRLTLRQRAARRRSAALSGPGFFGVLFRSLRVVIMVAAGVSGGLYVYRNFLVWDPGRGARDLGAATKVGDVPGWHPVDKVAEPTRRFLDRLDRVAKELPRLKGHFQELEDYGFFREKEFREGSRYRLKQLWQERKDYPILFWTSELEYRRARFEAAVARAKQERPLESDPATITHTYKFAGKLLGLPLQDGRFVDTGIPRRGPEAVMFDLKQIEAGLKGP
jgi:hypothetical protein